MIFMKKKGFVAAAMAAVLASSMLSVPAFAWSKDDIIAGDEHTLIVSYHWSDIDRLTIGDTQDGTHFITSHNLNCIAIVMEDENTVPDMTTISSDLTAVPAESYQFDGLYEYWNNQIATLFSPLLNLKTTYFVSASEQDAEKFYQLPGVEAVYEVRSEAHHSAWIGDGTSASINVSVKVSKGTDFGIEQCADLPYTVSSVTEIESTDDAMDAYKLVVKVPDGKIYKAALDMLRTLLEEDIVPDASVSYMMTELALAGKPVLKEVPNHYLAANSDLDGDGTVDVQDAVELLTYYARKAANLPASFSHLDDQEAALQLADVNKDGNIDTADAIEILTYYTKQAAGLL